MSSTATRLTDLEERAARLRVSAELRAALARVRERLPGLYPKVLQITQRWCDDQGIALREEPSRG